MKPSLLPAVRFLIAALVLMTVSVVRAQPDNDDLARAIVLVGESHQTEIFFLGATLAADDPPALYRPAVWYRWKAPREGWLRLAPYPLVELFQWRQSGPLIHQEPVSASYARFYQVAAGQDYAIAVMAPDPNWDGTFTPLRFELLFSGPPPNDLFGNRIPFAGDRVEARGPTMGASQQPGEPFAAVWWTWTAPASGLAQLELIDGTGDSVAAYTGSSLETLELAGQVPHPQHPVSFAVEAGRQYHLAGVSSQREPVAFRLSLQRWLAAQGVEENRVFDQGASLEVQFTGPAPGEEITNLFVQMDSFPVLDTNTMAPLRLLFLTPGRHTLTAFAQAASGLRYTLSPITFGVSHPNENFAGRPELIGDDVTVAVNLDGAPFYWDALYAWWKWTAPRSGVIHYEHVSGDGIVWRLYKGDSIETLVEAPDWSVQAGETYSLQASTAGGAGVDRFRILDLPPRNDAFAQARVIDGTEFSEPLRLDAATAEPGEPGDPLPSVWYAFTPAADGVVTLGGGASPSHLIAYLWPASVFTGETLETLAEVRPLDEGYQFPVKAGQRYQLRLRKAFPGDASYPCVYFLFTPSPANDTLARAAVLSGERASFEVALQGATASAEDPANYISLIPQRSTWYQWTAPRDGFAAITFDDRPQIGVEVFTNAADLSPAPARLLEDEGLFFQAQAGVNYLIRFSDFSGLWTNRFSARLSLSTRSLLTPASGESFLAPAGPEISLPVDFMAQSVSFREKTGEGSGGHWRWAEWQTLSDLAAPPFRVQTTNLSVGWHTFYAVARDAEGAAEYFPPVTFSIRPANDDFATRERIAGRKIALNGSIITATVEPGEPAMGSPPADQTVWYTWVAPSAAPATINMFGENYLRVYQGAALDSLVPVISSSPLSWQCKFTPVPGDTYQIAVGRISSNPPAGHFTTFGLTLTMELLQFISPATNGLVFTTDSVVPIQIATLDLPSEVAATSFKVSSDTPLERSTLLEQAGLAPQYFWSNPPPGNHTITATLTFRSGEQVQQNRALRVYPVHADFTNALALEPAPGSLQPAFAGMQFPGAPSGRGLLWYRFTARTNGYLVLTKTNLSNIDLQISTGPDTNHLQIIPQMGNLSQRGWTAIAITNGVTYNLRFQGYYRITLPVIQYEVLTAPANDLYENAEALAGNSLSVRSPAGLGTNQPGEPAHFGTPAQRTLWWTWTAPGKGWVSISGRAKAYTGSQLNELTALTGRTLVNPGAVLRIVSEPSSGLLYSDWKLDFSPVPPNDDFQNRQPLTGRRVTFRADLVSATTEPGEQAVFPGGWNYGHTVWFAWTPPASGLAVARRLPGAAWANALLFRGSGLSSLVLLQEDAYAPFQVLEGEEIQICVDFNGGGPAFTTLEIVLLEPPSNDAVSNALPLSSGASVSSWNFGATREWGEPSHAATFGSRSVWFRWLAPSSGGTELTLSGDIATNLLAVYQGNTVTELMPVASSTGALTNSLWFSAQEGQSYVLAVDGAYGATGDFNLSLRQEIAPAPPRILNAARAGNALVLSLLPSEAMGMLQRSEDLLNWHDHLFLEPWSDKASLPLTATNAFYRIKR